MTTPSIGDMATSRIAVREARRSRARWRQPELEWSVPPGITLPATIAVSLVLWAGLAFAVKSLFF